MMNLALGVAPVGLMLAALGAAVSLVTSADAGPQTRRYARRVAIPCAVVVGVYVAMAVVVALVD
jgi:hypothetical protein